MGSTDMMRHYPQIVCISYKHGHSLTQPQYQHRNRETNIFITMIACTDPIQIFTFVPVMPFLAKGTNNLGLCNACSSLFHFFWSGIVFQSFLNFHDLDTFEDYRPAVLHNAPQFEITPCYFMMWFRVCIYGRTITKALLC